jgi:hypothetical protein
MLLIESFEGNKDSYILLIKKRPIEIKIYLWINKFKQNNNKNLGKLKIK